MGKVGALQVETGLQISRPKILNSNVYRKIISYKVIRSKLHILLPLQPSLSFPNSPTRVDFNSDVLFTFISLIK